MNGISGKRLTPAGMVVTSCFVLSLLAGWVARELFPQSLLGASLGTAFGMLMVFASAWLAFVLAWVVCSLAGHPCLDSQTAAR